LFVIEGSTECESGVMYLPSRMPKKLAALHSSMYCFVAGSRKITLA
jgi:hypothetical protein